MLDADKTRWTLNELARNQAVKYGDRLAITFESSSDLTYLSLFQRSEALAAIWLDLGVVKGDRILAIVGNRSEFVVGMLAATRIGAIWTMINTELKGAFLEHQLKNSDPVMVVAHSSLVPSFAGFEADPKSVLKTLIIIGDHDGGLPPALGAAVVLDWGEVEGRLSSTPLPDPPLYNDTAAIMYTSGTTGPAKGVLMPHAHCFMYALGTVRATDLAEDDVYYICMPIFHVNALMMQLLGSLLAGTVAHVVDRFSPSRWLDDVIRTEATITNGLGVITEFIWNTEPTERDLDNSLSRMMAVPISGQWASGFEERFGLDIVQGYGMTECNIPCYTRPDDPLIPGLAGWLLDDWFEWQVVDPETDEPLDSGATGELVVRPLLAAGFMSGYFRMPDKTVEAWRNLWFHTGDACFLDELGRMHFVDRLKDCIRRRGENISSFEVEQVLNLHPLITESAVVAVKVEGAGGEDEVMACLVLNAEAIDQVDLLDFCAERMPRFAVPRFVRFIDEVPKTTTGKPQKKVFSDQGVTSDSWDRESVGYRLAR